MKWTLPNTLTVIRLAAAPAFALSFVIFTRPTADLVALVLFIFAALTDFFDGDHRPSRPDWLVGAKPAYLDPHISYLVQRSLCVGPQRVFRGQIKDPEGD